MRSTATGASSRWSRRARCARRSASSRAPCKPAP